MVMVTRGLNSIILELRLCLIWRANLWRFPESMERSVKSTAHCNAKAARPITINVCGK